jgi:hypothetical protein
VGGRIRGLVPDVEHFRRRVLQDALAEATSGYWLRRAEALERARPRVGDYPGRASAGDLVARWQELTDIALACRRAATLARWQTEQDAPHVEQAIREAS